MPSYKLTDTHLVARTLAASTGWTAFTSLQTVFDLARTQGLPVFLQPGVYSNGALSVSTATGSGKPLQVEAVPGTATILYTGGGTPLSIDGVSSVKFLGVKFDGQNLALPVYAGNTGESRLAFIAVKATTGAYFEDCQVVNSPGIGVYVYQAQARVEGCYVGSHSVGLMSEDSRVFVRRNAFAALANNGVVIWRTDIGGDSSEVVGNTINGVDTKAGGTGQNGNGVLVFKASAVTIADNRIFSPKFSGVRCNGATQVVIEGNSIWNARETGVFIEAPGFGIDTHGAIVSNNHIDTTATGIAVANANLYGDGVAHSVVIEGNRISNLRITTISDPGYSPPQVGGVGITAETDCVISGNIVDTAQAIGIMVGTNNATKDICVTGNLISSSVIGVGVSYLAVNGSVGDVVVSGNIVRGATNGAIVPIQSTGTSLVRVGTTDYGAQLATTAGRVTFGHNRAVA